MKVHDKDYTGKNLAELAAQVFNKQVDTAVIYIYTRTGGERPRKPFSPSFFKKPKRNDRP